MLHAKAALRRETNYDLAWWLLIGSVIRVMGHANFLGLFYGYGAAGGNPLMKLSPGTYIVFFVWMVALRRPNPPGMEDFKLPSLLLVSIVVCGLGWAVIGGGAVAVGYLVDSYLVAAAGIFVLGKIGPKGRSMIFEAIVWALALNAIMLFAEYILKVRFVPTPLEGALGTFRPAAMLNHPLMSGLMYATAVPLVMLWRRPFWLRSLFSVLFALCVFASGARISTIMAAVAFAPAFLTALVMERPKTTVGQTWMATQGVMIFGMIPAIISFAIASGFFDRISNGLVDKSAMTRLWQYGMLQYLTPHQIMFGASTTTAADWSTRLFQTPSIENSFVLGVFTYGMPFTVFYLTMVIFVVCIFAIRGSMLVKIAAAVFLAAALSNNTFGAKNPAVFYMLMMSGATMIG
ncbi:VpsF family polysaccharide biosynthesis protein, partial [Brevundimonas sp.]|uniref:VpsF family polysaccharide biosynthesis protein n=1 Tax=Brevundimonas sp. TaxID=1871086 RepID=UPI003782DD01